jgi:DNA-directed RNA polymerase subunit N (RpoN/RPB10)
MKIGRPKLRKEAFDSLGLKDYGCHRGKVNENKRSKNKK